MNLDQLDEPFAAEDIEWRIQQSGKTRDGKVWALVLAYVTNRAIMKRTTMFAAKQDGAMNTAIFPTTVALNAAYQSRLIPNG